MGTSRRVAYALAAVAAAAVGGGIVLLAMAPSGQGAMVFGGVTALGLCNVGCGLVVAIKRPTNKVGPLLMLVGLQPLLIAVTTAYGSIYAARPGLLPAPAPLLITLTQGTWMLLYLPPAMLMLIVPDGRLPGPRFRIVVAGLLVVPAVFDVVVAFAPGRFQPPFERVPRAFPAAAGPAHVIVTVATAALLLAFLSLLIASAAAMVVRYRRSADPVSRAQLRWFALGALALPATLLLCWASYLFLGGPDLVVVGFVLTALAIPAATAVAMLRHDLYDVDKAISFAVTYGVVTVTLLTVYSAAAFLGGVALGRGSTVTAAAATAVAAAVLAPLRSRLQRRVDQRLYPARQAALSAIEDLRARTHLGQAKPEQLEETLRAALRDPRLRIGYRLPGEDGLVTVDGAPLGPADGLRVPVRVGEHEIGALIRGSAGSRELLREIAAASSLLVEVVGLRIQLSRAIRDVEDSRTRLLHAGYAERRRLERDLHDGAQQRLVSVGMALRVAQRHLGDGSVDVDGLIDQTVAQLGTAVAELRQIANGLRPGCLDDGLAAALASLASTSPVPVVLEVCPDTLPDDLATTAYFVASEAITNAVKHARADSITLRMTHADGHLTLSVRDDGVGGAQAGTGSGLAGLSDRVAAAGGTLHVSSQGGHGTIIRAVLPCAS